MSTAEAEKAMIGQIAERQPYHFGLGSEFGSRMVSEAAKYMPIGALKNNAGNMIVDAIDEAHEVAGLITPYENSDKTDQGWAIKYGAQTAVHGALNRITGGEVL